MSIDQIIANDTRNAYYGVQASTPRPANAAGRSPSPVAAAPSVPTTSTRSRSR